MTSEKCDKCGGTTTRGRHHKHCRSCVNCTDCGWSNTHNMMFKDYTPWMGYGAEEFDSETKMGQYSYETTCDCGTKAAWDGGYKNPIEVEQIDWPSPAFDHFEMELTMKCPNPECDRYHYCVIEEDYLSKPKFSAEEMASEEGFEAEGNPKKTTSTIYANFYVGHSDKKGELAGNGKFKKYDDALAKAKEVAKKEGHSRIVSPRGFALWTSDGKGLFQAGKSTAEAREFYRAEDGSINMNGYATEYMEAEDMYFSAPPHPLHPTRPSKDYDDSRDRRRNRPKRGFSATPDLEGTLDMRQDKKRMQLGKRKAKGIALRNIRKEKRLARKRAEGGDNYYDSFMESRTTLLLALIAGVSWGAWITKTK